ncbi:hypothetical protein BH09ACT7_BH09ACT7_30540 [soil metagenome]
MPASAYIGRLGGLAVALGVGAAVATGHGVALADTAGSDSADAPSSASTDSPSKKSTAGPRASGPRSAISRPASEADPASDPVTGPARNSGTAPVAEKPDKRAKAAKDPSTEAPATASNGAELKAPLASVARTPTLTGPGQQVKAAVTDKAATVVERPTAIVASVGGAASDAVTAVRAPAPVAQAVPAVEAAVPVTVRKVVTGVLAAFGLGALANNLPGSPAAPPALLALLAIGSRRETQQAFSAMGGTVPTSSTPVAVSALSSAPLAAAAVTTPVTTRVGWLTGANSLNNTVQRFGIAGTDVGLMWDNGILTDNPATVIVEQRQVLIAFGDTFSGAGMTGVWRNNVLLRSADNVLSNGIYVTDGIIHDPGAYSGSPMSTPRFSREIIGKYGYAVGSEVTIIPTAAISVADAGANGATRQYVNFMSVRSWDTPGRWTTNYSGIIYSDDNGQNWTVVPRSTIRAAAAGRSTVPFIAGNQNFQQGAYVKPPAGSADAAAGWVYSYGTPAGRGGTVYVSRVNQNQILDQTKYQYWNGSSWVANKPSAATPILPGTTSAGFFGFGKTTTYPTVSEMSVQYNPYLKKYVMLYGDQKNNIVMRTSTTPQGNWSAPTTLATSTQYPGLYAPMIHPWSGSTLLKKADGTPEDPQYLYWNLSQWNEYNVALMRTDLSRV